MIWWLVFEKKSFQFWREIWIQVVVILLQLYICMQYIFYMLSLKISKIIMIFICFIIEACVFVKSFLTSIDDDVYTLKFCPPLFFQGFWTVSFGFCKYFKKQRCFFIIIFTKCKLLFRDWAENCSETYSAFVTWKR